MAKDTNHDVFGYSWETIKAVQQKQGQLTNAIINRPGKDYVADPIGDGTFRMVPSGDIVDFAECQRRLT